MNQEGLSDIVEKIVVQELAANYEFISAGLAQDLDWDEGWEQTISRAMINAVKVSTRVSVQTILEIFASIGILKISEQDNMTPKLTVLQGGPQNSGNIQGREPPK